MNRITYTLFTIIIVLMSSCRTTQSIPITTIEFDETLLDTLTVTASKPDAGAFKIDRYNPAEQRVIDLIHMDLAVSFDWTKEFVNGEATLTLKPYFYEIDKVTLDAVQMDIEAVKNAKTGKELVHENTGEQLIIKLGRKFTKDEVLQISIKYVAKPSFGAPQLEGYNPSDQGLYFINSDGSDPLKPMQIWTQGETEYNSHWFPTVDKPNERYTHDIHLTVQDKFKTLSNGYLVKSEKNGNMRTDHWKMDDEHAPYLTMITVGEFAVVEDSWKDIPLMYYVEKEYEASAQKIFNHTPEMLDYFSKITGVEFPWDKYAQVVIRDFVAGAMENTTAVTFGEFVQKTEKELIDDDNDDIVAHEMFHHWFGDYVTCESWANLTLNEGFANYSEYLWTQNKYGQDEADNKRLNELSGYMYQANNQGTHPLIHYSYSDKEQMFDAHSYNKGGLVLHMLRNEIDDEAFYAGMEKYLKDNAGNSVEVDELRIAYEEVTGKDLQVFFNQWYLESGHPDLEITYDRTSPIFSVKVSQAQSPEKSIAIFQIPLHFDLYMKTGDIVRVTTFMNEREKNYVFDEFDNGEIDWVNFDPDHALLGEWQENRSMESYLKEYQQSSSQYDKREVLEALKTEKVDIEFYKNIIKSNDNYINKIIAVSRFPYESTDAAMYANALEKADHKQLKYRIMDKFQGNEQDISEATLISYAENGPSWTETSIAIDLLSKVNWAKAKSFITTYKDSDDQNLISGTFKAIEHNQGMEYWPYMITKIANQPVYTYNYYGRMMAGMLLKADAKTLESSMKIVDKQFFQSTAIPNSKKAALASKLVVLKDSISEENRKLYNRIIEEMKLKDYGE